MPTVDRYAVMGNPIHHSKSPRIHSLFAAQTGQRLEYTAILVPIGEFAVQVDAFRDAGGRGLSVTVPFKQEAWVYVDGLGARAERAGAVNTIVFGDDGESFGDNTDGIGLIRDLLHNHAARLEGRRILLLGAGGAARGVVDPLLEQGPESLVIANRTPEKAVELALLFGDKGRTCGCRLEELAGQAFDLIINATAAGLDDALPPLPQGVLAPGGWCYDLMYADTPTAFVRWGREHGAARAVDGLGMLVEQAAEAFYLWRGVRPDTGPVIRALRN
nr:shikimate dehydrogenase [Pseudomonadota bacterium]